MCGSRFIILCPGVATYQYISLPRHQAQTTSNRSDFLRKMPVTVFPLLQGFLACFHSILLLHHVGKDYAGKISLYIQMTPDEGISLLSIPPPFLHYFLGIHIFRSAPVSISISFSFFPHHQPTSQRPAQATLPRSLRAAPTSPAPSSSSPPSTADSPYR